MSKFPYISDAATWEVALKQSAPSKHLRRNKTQVGRGFQYRRKRFIIPVKPIPKSEAKIEQVTPSAAVEDRAESDLRQEREEKQPHVLKVKVPRKSIKRRTNGKKRSLKKKSARSTTKKRKRTRKLFTDLTPSIFDKRLKK